jgi:hypothetical protein
LEDREGRPCVRKRGISGSEGVYDVDEGIRKSDKFTEKSFVTRLYTAIASATTVNAILHLP